MEQPGEEVHPDPEASSSGGIPSPPPAAVESDLGLGTPWVSSPSTPTSATGTGVPVEGAPAPPSSELAPSISQTQSPIPRPSLNLPDSVVEDIQKDPFSYLGNIQYEDIYVIQKLYARKQGRFFASAIGGGGNFFSEFSSNWAHGLGGGFFFSDVLGWEVVQAILTSAFYNRRAQHFLDRFGLRSNIFEYRVSQIFSSALIVSPFYGKLSLLGFRVVHYDMYFLLGPAAVIYESTLGFGGLVGLGFRLYLNKWTTLGLEFRDYLFTGSPPRAVSAATGDTSSFFTSRLFIFLNLSVHFPKFAFLDEV
jgi:outer membrane beta-barrel protein